MRPGKGSFPSVACPPVAEFLNQIVCPINVIDDLIPDQLGEIENRHRHGHGALCPFILLHHGLSTNQSPRCFNWYPALPKLELFARGQ